MAEGFGDVLVTPGLTSVAEVKPGDVIAAMGQGILVKGVTLLADQGTLAAGTVLGQITASEKYVAYDDDGTDDGRRVARGVLLETVNTTGSDKLGNIIYGGVLKNSALVGIDANGVADLNARQDTTRDLFIF
jgi:hypothetical protein